MIKMITGKIGGKINIRKAAKAIIRQIKTMHISWMMLLPVVLLTITPSSVSISNNTRNMMELILILTF